MQILQESDHAAVLPYALDGAVRAVRAGGAWLTKPRSMTVMFKLLPVCLACTLLVPPASAMREPDTDAFDGKWKVSIQGSGKSPKYARLELAKFAGTWHDLGRHIQAKAKDCKGTKFAVTVQTSVAALMEFTIWGSSVSAACSDISASVMPISDKVLEGTLETGEKIRLTRS